jgi:hypothetical protein
VIARVDVLWGEGKTWHVLSVLCTQFHHTTPDSHLSDFSQTYEMGCDIVAT